MLQLKDGNPTNAEVVSHETKKADNSYYDGILYSKCINAISVLNNHNPIIRFTTLEFNNILLNNKEFLEHSSYSILLKYISNIDILNNFLENESTISNVAASIIIGNYFDLLVHIAMLSTTESEYNAYVYCLSTSQQSSLSKRGYPIYCFENFLQRYGLKLKWTKGHYILYDEIMNKGQGFFELKDKITLFYMHILNDIKVSSLVSCPLFYRFMYEC